MPTMVFPTATIILASFTLQFLSWNLPNIAPTLFTLMNTQVNMIPNLAQHVSQLRQNKFIIFFYLFNSLSLQKTITQIYFVKVPSSMCTLKTHFLSFKVFISLEEYLKPQIFSVLLFFPDFCISVWKKLRFFYQKSFSFKK